MTDTEPSPEIEQYLEGVAIDILRTPVTLSYMAWKIFRDSAAWFPAVHGRGVKTIRNHYTLGLGGEVGEVIEVMKKADVCGGLMDTCDLHKPGKHSVEALESEMADVLTYLLAMAHIYDIDLLAAYLKKRSENVERWGEPEDA